MEEPAGSAADDAAQLRREEEEEQKRKSKAAAADTEEAPADEEDDDDASIPGPAAGRRGKRKARVAALGAEKKKAKGSGKKKGRAAAAAAAAVSDTEDLVALSVSSGPWSCGACTFSNGKDALACGVCGSPKPVGGGAASRSWKCGVCTMVNEPDRDKCAMCGSIKEATTAAAAGAGDDSQMMDLTGSSTAAAAGAAAPPSSSSKSKRNSNAAAASAPDPPKLTDNRVFLAGLEESLGSVHVSPYFKSRLAHTLKKQWLILDSKMAGVSPLQMPLEDLRECQKALVHSACLKALRAQRTLELLLNCGQFEIDQLAAAQCLHCATSGAAVNLLLTTKNCFHPICGPCGAKYIKESMGRRTCFQLTCPSSSCNLEITPGFVQRCLSKAEFSVYNDLCFELSTADPSKYQTCPIETCKVTIWAKQLRRAGAELLQQSVTAGCAAHSLLDVPVCVCGCACPALLFPPGADRVHSSGSRREGAPAAQRWDQSDSGGWQDSVPCSLAPLLHLPPALPLVPVHGFLRQLPRHALSYGTHLRGARRVSNLQALSLLHRAATAGQIGSARERIGGLQIPDMSTDEETCVQAPTGMRACLLRSGGGDGTSAVHRGGLPERHRGGGWRRELRGESGHC